MPSNWTVLVQALLMQCNDFWPCWPWPYTTLNSISALLDQLTNRKVSLYYLVIICHRKTKDCAMWVPKIKCRNVVFIFAFAKQRKQRNKQKTNFINKQIILQKHSPQLARLFEVGEWVQNIKLRLRLTKVYSLQINENKSRNMDED